MAARDAQPAQTLDRGLRVLRLLAEQPDGLRVAEIAVALGVHRAVVYRLLSPLEAHRLVARARDGRIRLGGGLVELARAVARTLTAVALPHMRALAEELGATATLTVARGDEAVALAVVEPRNTNIHVAYRVGLRHPLVRGASGKAILAGRPPASGEDGAVSEARRRGYAVTSGELQPGAVGIAAPIAVDGWADASLGVVSLTDLGDEAGERVRRAAAAVAAEIA